jgi:hypothetical protein
LRRGIDEEAAQFEILVNGKPRSYRDTKIVAIDSPKKG